MRLRLEAVLRGLVLGLVVGAIVSLLATMANILINGDISHAVLFVIPASALVSALVCAFIPVSLDEIARIYDSRYSLKNRLTTAIELLAAGNSSPVASLQIDDAIIQFGAAIDAKGIPVERPMLARWSLVAVIISVAFQFLPWTNESLATQDVVVRPAMTTADIERLDEVVQQAEELAEESTDDEFRDLADDLHEMVQTLKSPDTDLYQALETISDLQHKLEEHGDSFNIAQTDTQLKSLGEAMTGAPAFDKASQALQQGDFQKAAEHLETLDAEDLKNSDSDKIADNLSDVSEEMKESELNELSESVSELARAAKEQSSEDMQSAGKDLASQLEEHVVRKKLSDFMQSQNNLLSDMKAQARASVNQGGDSRNGSNASSLAQGKTNKRSGTPSTSTSAKEAGNIDGPQTSLDSQRNLVHLKGQLGSQGESEKESIASAEGTVELSDQQIVEQFHEYSRISEAVLESEEIPSGHRQVIRRYFERIRPAGVGLTPENSGESRVSE